MPDLNDKYHMDDNGNFRNQSEYEEAVENGDLQEAGGKFWADNGDAFDKYGNKY